MYKANGDTSILGVIYFGSYGYLMASDGLFMHVRLMSEPATLLNDRSTVMWEEFHAFIRGVGPALDCDDPGKLPKPCK